MSGAAAAATTSVAVDPSIAAEVAAGKERDKGLSEQIALLRRDIERIEARLWVLAVGSGAASGAVGVAAAKLLEALGG